MTEKDSLQTNFTSDEVRLFLRPPDKSVNWKIIFISHPKHIVVGTQKNTLNEMVLLSTQNTCLNYWVRND